jgi:hypothetical protein
MTNDSGSAEFHNIYNVKVQPEDNARFFLFIRFVKNAHDRRVQHFTA